ncbi:unnamed protein product [Symbiodinium natans]|uniref:Uncharacterized protein n=1 Tax=Symbiodinium natans TaxID=878477 RepID=A0A812JDD3_9DINO|nr:unnamed protein product [Symbiodinium natans]
MGYPLGVWVISTSSLRSAMTSLDGLEGLGGVGGGMGSADTGLVQSAGGGASSSMGTSLAGGGMGDGAENWVESDGVGTLSSLGTTMVGNGGGDLVVMVLQLVVVAQGRQLAEVAAAAIAAIPLETTASKGWEFGFFPNGQEAEAPMPVMSLAFLLLRRVTLEDVASTTQLRGREAELKAEATLSMLAAGIHRHLNKDALSAEQHFKKRENEMAQLRQDLDDQRWSEEANRRHLCVAAGPSSKELEKELQAKSGQVEDARDYRDECFLRVLILSRTWLQYCHTFLNKDKAQSKLLDDAPVLQGRLQTETSYL